MNISKNQNDKFNIVVLPTELIEIILGYIADSKDYKLILSCRSVNRYWYSKFKIVKKYDINNKIQKINSFENNIFKTYTVPFMNLDKVKIFKKSGSYKYLKFNNFGRVICVIKCDTDYTIERIHLNNRQNKIIKKKYDALNDILVTEINTATINELNKLQNEKDEIQLNINFYQKINFPSYLSYGYIPNGIGSCLIS